MYVKKISTLIIIFISCILIKSAYPTGGIELMFNGVPANNNIQLLSANFIYFAALVFYLFGQSNKFLNGYGKYVLLRSKKRNILLNKLIVKSFFTVFTFEIIRIALFILLLFFKNEPIFNFEILDLVKQFLISLLVMFSLIELQIFIEIKYSASSSLILVFSYYIISCMIGGYCIERGFLYPLLILLPNYSMSYRNTIMFNEININYSTMYAIVIAIIILIYSLSKKHMKTKDIF